MKKIDVLKFNKSKKDIDLEMDALWRQIPYFGLLLPSGIEYLRLMIGSMLQEIAEINNFKGFNQYIKIFEENSGIRDFNTAVPPLKYSDIKTIKSLDPSGIVIKYAKANKNIDFTHENYKKCVFDIEGDNYFNNEILKREILEIENFKKGIYENGIFESKIYKKQIFYFQPKYAFLDYMLSLPKAQNRGDYLFYLKTLLLFNLADLIIWYSDSSGNLTPWDLEAVKNDFPKLFGRVIENPMIPIYIVSKNFKIKVDIRSDEELYGIYVVLRKYYRAPYCIFLDNIKLTTDDLPFNPKYQNQFSVTNLGYLYFFGDEYRYFRLEDFLRGFNTAFEFLMREPQRNKIMYNFYKNNTRYTNFNIQDFGETLNWTKLGFKMSNKR